MELVRGVPITEFCDQHELDTHERLRLFVTVCHAEQHAHQKGVIHRDVKPSNVLVTLHDDTPVVKVIDFGVAKAIGQQLTDKTIYTRFAAMIGTPLYMSPEQAEMSGLDIDTRSDIYSLGVLLYELLTGSTPFDSERLQSAGFDELRRIIREEEPPRPSMRLTTRGQALSTVSAKRKIEPRKLSALVRGDLDWIVMKAIDKDRGRRYETAAAVAADLERFLREEPIEARPPSALYRFHKLTRRHRVAITTVSIVAAALVLGTAISVWQAARAVAERDEKVYALKDAVRARNEADRARKNVEEFAERLKGANILLASGRAHADAGRWPAAHVDYTHATETQPNYYLVWVERGSLCVRLGLWQLAAADFGEAFELGAPADGPSWWGVPQLLWYTGDERRYRQVCAQLLRASDDSARALSSHVIRSCLLATVSGAELVAFAEQAEKLLTDTPDGPPGRPFGDRPPPRPRDERGSPDGPERRSSPNRSDGPGHGRSDGPGRPPDFGPKDGTGRPDDAGRPTGPGPRFRSNWLPRGASLYVAGWVHFRAGNLDRSIERLRASHDDDPGWPGRGISYPVLAMAYHRAGRGDEAREALAEAEKLIDGWMAEVARGPVGSMPIPWFDWIECLVLFREAKILITGFAPPDDPRLREVEARAIGAIRSADTSTAPR